jgi:hypothetical protein
MVKTVQSDKCIILATVVCIDTGRQTGLEGEVHHDEWCIASEPCLPFDWSDNKSRKLLSP